MQGSDVRRLHEALEQLDFDIPPGERLDDVFGPGTKKAVQELQRRHSQFASRTRGIVDQATVNLITSMMGRYAV